MTQKNKLTKEEREELLTISVRFNIVMMTIAITAIIIIILIN